MGTAYHRAAALVALVLIPSATRAQENSTSAIPSVGGTVQSIRFFDAVPPVPRPADRTYATRFDANRARYIYTEITIRHEPTGTEGVEYTVVCSYYSPSGEKIGDSPLVFRPQPEWQGAVSVNAWGSARSGAFKPGFHRVICSHEGNPVVEAGFDVFEGPPAIPLVDGHFTSLRFFSWEDAMPAIADRVYATSFEAATTQRIGMEIRLRFPEPGRLVMIPVHCRVLGPDGSVLREYDQSLRVEPSWASVVSATNLVTAETASWAPGTYVGTCHHGETLLGDARFVIR